MSYGQGGYGQGGYGQGGQGGYGGNSNPYGQPAGNPYGGSGGGYGQSNPYGQQSSYNQPPAQSNPYGQQSSYGRQQQQQPAPYDPPQQSYNGGGYGAQPQSNTYADNAGYEMGAMNGEQPSSAIGQPRKDDYSPRAHLDRCKEIDGYIKSMTENMADLEKAQRQAKDSIDGKNSKNSPMSQVEHFSRIVMNLSREATHKLQLLKGYPNAGDELCKTQISHAQQRLTTAIQRYQAMDQAYHKSLREQAERQFRIVRPDATEAEVREAVEDANAQIFSQALMQSDRRGQSASTLAAVKDRSAAIKKIEKDILELSELFVQMNEIIITQEAQVQQIDQQAADVETNVQAATVELSGGITKARAARKKKWICLGIVVAIIIIVVIIVLAWGYGSGTFKTSSNKTS